MLTVTTYVPAFSECKFEECDSPNEEPLLECMERTPTFRCPAVGVVLPYKGLNSLDLENYKKKAYKAMCTQQFFDSARKLLPEVVS